MEIEPLNFVTAIKKEEVYESTAEAMPLTLNTIKSDSLNEFWGFSAREKMEKEEKEKARKDFEKDVEEIKDSVDDNWPSSERAFDAREKARKDFDKKYNAPDDSKELDAWFRKYGKERDEVEKAVTIPYIKKVREILIKANEELSKIDEKYKKWGWVTRKYNISLDNDYGFYEESINKSSNILNELWFKSTPETEELYKEKAKMRVWLRKNAKEEYKVLTQKLKDEMEKYAKEFNDLERSMKKAWDGYTQEKDEPKLDAIGKEWAQKEYEMIKAEYDRLRGSDSKTESLSESILFESDGDIASIMQYIATMSAQIADGMLEKRAKEKEKDYPDMSNMLSRMTQGEFRDAERELEEIKIKNIKAIEQIKYQYNKTIQKANGDENIIDNAEFKKQEQLDTVTTNFLDAIDKFTSKYGIETKNYNLMKESILYEATGLIKSLAQKSGKSIEEVEALWKKARAQAEKQGKKPSDGSSYYRYVTGILKKMLSIKESKGRDFLWNEYAYGEMVSLTEASSTDPIEMQREIIIKNYKIEYQKLMDAEYREHQDATRKLWPMLKNYVEPEKKYRGFIQLIKDLWSGKKPIVGEPTINFREIYDTIQQWKKDRQQHWITVRTSGPKHYDPKSPSTPAMQITADAAYETAMLKYGVDIERLIDEYDAKNKMLAMKYQEEWADFLEQNGRRIDKLTDLPYFLKALGESVENLIDSVKVLNEDFFQKVAAYFGNKDAKWKEWVDIQQYIYNNATDKEWQDFMRNAQNMMQFYPVKKNEYGESDVPYEFLKWARGQKNDIAAHVAERGYRRSPEEPVESINNLYELPILTEGQKINDVLGWGRRILYAINNGTDRYYKDAELPIDFVIRTLTATVGIPLTMLKSRNYDEAQQYIRDKYLAALKILDISPALMKLKAKLHAIENSKGKNSQEYKAVENSIKEEEKQIGIKKDELDTEYKEDLKKLADEYAEKESINRICVPCSDGNYILAERCGDVINFYHGIAVGAREQKDALKYYPQLLSFGKQGH